MRKTAKTPTIQKIIINKFLQKLKSWLIEEESKEENIIKFTKINKNE